MKKTLFLLLISLCLFSSTSLADTQNISLGDESAYSIAYFQGKLYISGTSGLNCVTDEIEKVQTADDDSLGFLIPTEDALFSYSRNPSPHLDRLVMQEEVLMQTCIMLDGSFYASQVAVTDRFVVLFCEDLNEQYLICYDMQQNTSKEYRINNFGKVTSYEGDLLLCTYVQRTNQGNMFQLVSFDLLTGNIEVLCDLPENYAAIEWDQTNHRAVLAKRGQVFCWDMSNGLRPAAYILSGDIIDLAVYGNYVAAAVDHYICISQMFSESESALTVADPYAHSADFSSFLKQNTSVSLQLCGNANSMPDDFINAMLSQDDKIDIFALDGVEMLHIVNSKQYGIDVSDLLSDLYAPFLDLLSTDNGAIYGFPARIELYMPAYNPAFFERYGFKVPTTWYKLFDLVLQWQAEDYNTTYDDTCFNLNSLDISVMGLLRAYLEECELNQRTLNFCDPQLEETLCRYQDAMAAFQNTYWSESIDMWPFQTIYLPQSAQYMPLELCFAPDALCAIGNSHLELTFYIVNPYSSNQRVAIDFLRCLKQDWPQRMKVLLLQDAAQPIQETLQDGSKEWYISPNDILTYQDFLGKITLQKTDVLSQVEDQMMLLWQQVEDGQLSVALFLEKAQDKLEMAQSE